jgi:hypothetical protein
MWKMDRRSSSVCLVIYTLFFVCCLFKLPRENVVRVLLCQCVKKIFVPSGKSALCCPLSAIVHRACCKLYDVLEIMSRGSPAKACIVMVN